MSTLNEDPTVYTPESAQKLQWLNQKWQQPKYKDMIEESSMITSLISKHTKPIHLAVLADNLSYFEKNYSYNSEDIELFLIEACLCGSENIAQYLLDYLKTDYIQRPELLGYIAGSMNSTWAEKVAHLLVQNNIPRPKSIFRFSDGEALLKLAKLFEH